MKDLRVVVFVFIPGYDDNALHGGSLRQRHMWKDVQVVAQARCAIDPKITCYYYGIAKICFGAYVQSVTQTRWVQYPKVVAHGRSPGYD